MRAGLTVRSYGFFVDGTLYSTASNAIPVLPNPFSTGTVVAYSTNVALAPFTDPFFRGFDNALPDYYRYTEWAREFDANYLVPAIRLPERPREIDTGAVRATPPAARGAGLPSLSLVRLMHDHTGSYSTAIDGVNTPEVQ